MTSGEKKLIWTIGILGGAAAIGGIAYALVKQRRDNLGSDLSPSLDANVAPAKIVGQTKKGGMTVTHWYAKKLPIKNRVALVQDMVYKSVQDPEMRILALRITNGCKPRDKLCELKAVDAWMRRPGNYRYAGDVAPIKLPNGKVEPIDYFQTAKRTVQAGAGDCDDAAVLGATLLSFNDIEARLRITSAQGYEWSHIYVVGKIDNEWVPLDATLPNSGLGVEVPYANKQDYKASRRGMDFPA